MTKDTNHASGAEEHDALLQAAKVFTKTLMEMQPKTTSSQLVSPEVQALILARAVEKSRAATPAERDLTGAALASIRHLLQADPAAHAEVAIKMIDAMLLAPVAVPTTPARHGLCSAACPGAGCVGW